MGIGSEPGKESGQTSRSITLRYYGTAVAILLLLVFLCELAFSVRQQSLSWDEGNHIFAGYMTWKRADFGINPEHPPLVKALATIPLLPMTLKVPNPKGLASFKDEAYFDGSDFIFENGGEAGADRIIFRGRMAVASLSLFLALLVFLSAREMFGQSAALVALALFVFEPNIIAHGAYVTTDMGVSCFIFASLWALYRFVKAPSLGRLVILGVATGLALASKHSALLLLPISVALLLAEIFWTRDIEWPEQKKIALRFALGFLATSLIAIAVLWAFYGFRYAARPDGASLNPSLIEYVQKLNRVESRVYPAVARWHLLPESYLYGLIDVRRIAKVTTYIFGKIYTHSVWFYFPSAFIIKSTAASIMLMGVAVFAIYTGKLRGRREIAFLVISPVLYLLIAVLTGPNIGERHLLPMYAFLFVLIGGAVTALVSFDRRWAYLAVVLLAWHSISSLRAQPVTLAYSNEFWGGPANTYKYLTDSNTDWGQQLKSVKKYLDNRGIKDCWFAYFAEPYIQFSSYGIPCRSLPTGASQWTHYQIDAPPTVRGTVLISAGTLSGYEFGSKFLNPYQQFQQIQPVAIIDRGVFVYEGTFDIAFVSSFGRLTRAVDLRAAKQLDGALQEAKKAVEIDPDNLQAEVLLGDLLIALGRGTEARPAYQHALAIANQMEPSAKVEWVPKIEKKLATL